MADVLTARLERPRFTWGGGDLGDAGQMRQKYIDTLKAADNQDFSSLLAFARS